MKFAFFTDIHGNQYAWEAFKEKIKTLDIDFFIFGGDVCGYYYGQKQILDDMRNMPHLVCLLGNHDQMFLSSRNNEELRAKLIGKYGHSYENLETKIGNKNINFLKSWPVMASFTWENKNYAFFHGGPLNPLEERIYPDSNLIFTKEYEPYNYILVGHTHHKMEKKVETTTFINPGSIGQQRDGKGCSFIVMDTKTNQYKIYILEYSLDELKIEIDNFESDPIINRRFKEVLHRKR